MFRLFKRAGDLLLGTKAASPQPSWVKRDLLNRQSRALQLGWHSRGCGEWENPCVCQPSWELFTPSCSTGVQTILRSLVTYCSSFFGGICEVSWPQPYESTNLTVSPNSQVSLAQRSCHFHSSPSFQEGWIALAACSSGTSLWPIPLPQAGMEGSALCPAAPQPTCIRYRRERAAGEGWCRPPME